MVTQTINLNLVPDGVIPRLSVSQGDHGSRVFVFNLYAGKQIYEVPTGSVVLLNGTKPDGTPVSYNCEYDGSTVTADCEQQLTAVMGNVRCELEIVGSDGSKLGSANFIIFVELNPYVTADGSGADIASLQELVVEGATYAAQTRTAAGEAANSATAAAQSAAEAAEYLGTIDADVQRAVNAASNAEASEQASKASETNAAESEENAAASASAAASSASSASSSATTASASSTAAAGAATNAANSASAARTSATNAANSATSASESASDAAESATAANSASSTAQAAATQATNSAAGALTSANMAATSKNSAAESATAAASSASSASDAQAAAETAAENAEGYKNNAQTFANNAATSATKAQQSAATAAGSATNAANSMNAAQTYASNAESFADDAERYKNEAGEYVAQVTAAAGDAEAAALAANTSKTQAAGSAAEAAGYLATVQEDARKATNAAAAAAVSEENATQKASAAATSASNAAGSAQTASTSATAAAASATASSGSASAAQTSANAAKTSETNAAASATAAKGSEDSVAANATAAQNAATAAASSRNAAAGSATNAANSASAAATSATNASNSATAASNSASAARTSATNASSSASAALASQNTASSSASAASTSATNASNYATAANGFATTAGNYASAAQTSANSAASSNSLASASASAAATSASKAEQNALDCAETTKVLKEEFTTAITAVSSDTEVIDIRVEYDGTVADTAGDAVRAQAAANHLLASQAMSAFVVEETSGIIASFVDGADGVPLKDLMVNITAVQSGTGDPSPTNIRSISGWTEANITRCGKNLFDAEGIVASSNHSDYTYINDGYLRFATGGYEAVGINWKNIAIPCPVTFSGTIKNFTTNATNIVGVRMYFTDGTSEAHTLTPSGGLAANSEAQFSFTYGTSGKVVNQIITQFTDYRAAGFKLADTQLEIGSVATAFEPFAKTVYNVGFGSADTVYGGTLDVTSGMLTVTHGIVDLGTLTWSLAGSGRLNATLAACKQIPQSEVANAWCSNYRVVSNSTISGIDKSIAVGINVTPALIQVNDSTYNGGNPATFKAAVSGAMLVYELAQPISYQLDPVSVATLLGNNNIFADTGSVASCEYRADTKLYIEHLTNPDDDMVANSNITSGSYFMVNNSLYLATANIANGGAITPGTNCTATNLAAALNAINS